MIRPRRRRRTYTLHEETNIFKKSVSLIVVIVAVTASSYTTTLADSWDRPDMDLESDQTGTIMLNGSPSSLAKATSNGIQCEAIFVPQCKRMMYNTTRMPNFFNDFNQVEALTRAQKFQQLIESSCNPSISTYMCQLITPVCLAQDLETMYKFEIYPCRTFCRRMFRDCSQEISVYSRPLKIALESAFDCDRLPYESNPTNSNQTDSKLYGPCHDPSLDEQHQQQQQNRHHPTTQDESGAFINQNNPYRQYDHQLEDPYIADKSKLEPAIPSNQYKPRAKQPPIIQQQQQPNLHNHHQQHGTITTTTTNLSWTQQINSFSQSVISNIVKYSNVISIFIVLILLAVLNAKRLCRLRRLYSSSSASSSSASSACSSAPLNGGGLSGSLSKPRFGGGHLDAMSSSGTGSQAASGGGGGYHSALARHQQIYSNILLSSPSHQVLLHHDGSSPAAVRSKLMPLQAKRPGPPQTRAPLPPPFASAAGSYMSSDQQSTSSGYYDMPLPVGSQHISPYQQPHAADSMDRRRSSFRRPAPPSTNYSSSTTPTKCKQAASNNTTNMLFMG